MKSANMHPHTHIYTCTRNIIVEVHYNESQGTPKIPHNIRNSLHNQLGIRGRILSGSCEFVPYKQKFNTRVFFIASFHCIHMYYTHIRKYIHTYVQYVPTAKVIPQPPSKGCIVYDVVYIPKLASIVVILSGSCMGGIRGSLHHTACSLLSPTYA